MTPAPEQEARQKIDQLLEAAGWVVQDVKAANIHAGRGVALREFPLPGYGFADYLLYVDGRAAGVIEAKKVGVTLTGVEIQAERYTKGLPSGLPAWHNPLPFSHQSIGRWNAAIQELKRRRQVRQVGEKRGARYALSRPVSSDGGGE
jgi:type I restriction enzyme, R subunit